jgi:recombination protein RecT
MMKAIRQVLPNYISPERFVGMAVSAAKIFEKNPDINRSSILLAVFDAARYGLELGGPSGHAYLVPFGKIVQLITGYKGLIHLAKVNGGITYCTPFIVYSNDKFRMWIDESGQRFEHEPTIGERGVPRAAYCLIGIKGQDRPVFHWTHIERVQLIEKNAKKKGGAVWSSDREAMILKTAIRQAMKYQQICPATDAVIAKEEKLEVGIIEAAIPEEMREVVDTDYQEVVEEMNKEAVDSSTKPIVEMPKEKMVEPAGEQKPKTGEVKGDSSGTPAGATKSLDPDEDSFRLDFIDGVRILAMDKNLQDTVEGMCLAKFGCTVDKLPKENWKEFYAMLEATPQQQAKGAKK